MGAVINGIQQIGIGVTDAKTVFNWYRRYLGFDILVFEDRSQANLMTRYTAKNIEDRYAILAMNMTGGGGLEIWQFKSRAPKGPVVATQLGDLGINAMKLRTPDIKKAYDGLKELSLKMLTEVTENATFYFTDPWGNWVQVVQDNYLFSEQRSCVGGVLGTMIGVSDMDTSLGFYKKTLGYTLTIKDETGFFSDFLDLDGGKRSFRRVLLRHDDRKVGGFGKLYGPSEIELIQVLDRKPIKIYKDRLWGDLGYIHLCFDVNGMDAQRNKVEASGYGFTVDSADSFDMGDAAGRFAYMEDPDGTLIEMVETHKVPILKKMGIFIDLKKRDPIRPLPKWLVKCLRIHRRNTDI